MSEKPAVHQRTLDSAVPSVAEQVGARPAVQLGWRIALTVLLLALLALLGLLISPRLLQAAPAAAPSAQSTAAPLVLAFYYSWYDENTWTYDKLSDLPEQPYVSRDRAAMGRHIEQAQRAGIDAFLVAWYGPGGEFNQTEPNLTALLDEAAARGFKVGILFETDSPYLGSVEAVTGALQHVQAVHANHPAYLRADGRPVVFFWRPTLYGVETWRAIRSQVDGGAGLWIGEGTDLSYLAVFDGHHLYSNTWDPPADLTSVNSRYAAQVAAAGRLWVATAMPGYDDTKVRPGSGFARDREAGAYFARSWEAAIASQPAWIVVNSFNEWPEGSQIEPGAAHGGLYLDLTAGWAQQFKAGGGSGIVLPAAAPPAGPIAAPVAAATSAAAASPAEPTPAPPPLQVTEPTAVVEAWLLNVRGGPGTDFPILAQLPAGAAHPITGRRLNQPDWWQIDVDGQAGWVHAPLVRALGPVEQVPVLAVAGTVAEPAANEFTMTPLRDLEAPAQ